MDDRQDNLGRPLIPGPAGGLVVTLFALVLAILVAQLALLLAGGAGVIRYTDHGMAPWPFILLALCSCSGFIGVSVLLGILFRGRLLLSVRSSDLLPTAGGFGAILLVNVAMTALSNRIGEDYSGAPDLGPGGMAAAGVVLAAVVLAPLAEELFFREMLLTRALAGSPRWLAVATTAAAFGALHLAVGGVVLMLTLTFMGAVLAWLRFRTGSLGPPILVHALNNAVALALLS